MGVLSFECKFPSAVIASLNRIETGFRYFLTAVHHQRRIQKREEVIKQQVFSEFSSHFFNFIKNNKNYWKMSHKNQFLGC